MPNTFKKMLEGYREFRKQYATGDNSIMKHLDSHGQSPSTLVVACCDSRVDPALILQCEPGDLFTIRNVANIVPPYEADDKHHGTSAALEFGICYLKVKHIVILGHSKCGGMQARLNGDSLDQNDFISNWVSQIDACTSETDVDEAARKALSQSYQNCLTFPWIKERVERNELSIHLWFFDIKNGEITTFSHERKLFEKLA